MFSSASVLPGVSHGTITGAEPVTDLDGGAREPRRDRGARDARDARAQIMRPLREDGPKHTIGTIGTTGRGGSALRSRLRMP